jgi:hypothetical protein
MEENSKASTIFNHPTEWLKKPLLDRLEEIRKLNCTGPCENQTLLEAIALIKNDTTLLGKDKTNLERLNVLDELSALDQELGFY